MNETQFCWWLKGILCMQEPDSYLAPERVIRIAAELEKVLQLPKQVVPHALHYPPGVRTPSENAQDLQRYGSKLAHERDAMGYGLGGHDRISRAVVHDAIQSRGLQGIVQQNAKLAELDVEQRAKAREWLTPSPTEEQRLVDLAEKAIDAAAQREERREMAASTFEGHPLGTPEADAAMAAFKAETDAKIEADFAKADMSVLLKKPEQPSAKLQVEQSEDSEKDRVFREFNR